MTTRDEYVAATKQRLDEWNAEMAALEVKAAQAKEDDKARYQELLKGYEKAFGDSGDVLLFSSPGRTEISGNHTDHNHGKVLAVQGVVDDTSEEIFGVRGVAMGGNGDFKVYFVFPAERRNEAMSLARGDKVTIIGVSEFFIADGIVVMGATVAKDE